MQAYIGVIMLAGIVVSNAILLVDYINTLRRRDGMPLREAVEIGGRTRLRPMLMTSIATMLGLVPMAIGLGDGGELQAPLARVVIGGLLASTIVTLVLVPAVYTRVRGRLERHVPQGRGRRDSRDRQPLIEPGPVRRPDGPSNWQADPAGRLRPAQRRQQLPHRFPRHRIDPLRRELRERLEHEPALAKARMRNDEPGHPRSRRRRTESDRGRRVRGAPAYGRSRPSCASTASSTIEHRRRGERRLADGGGVEEERLPGLDADRLGFVEGRDAEAA